MHVHDQLHLFFFTDEKKNNKFSNDDEHAGYRFGFVEYANTLPHC